VDSGIEEGQTVGTSFDSMLAKLIVHAPNRDHALARMRYALDETVILGMGTNQNYLRTLASDPAVKEGRVHTGYLAEKYGDYAPKMEEQDLSILTAAHSQRVTSQRISAAAAGGSGSGSNGPVSPFSIYKGDAR
jgi:acetyl-CoA/propionyl-CoA carboxylase biotin carboxyl carrier protein